MPQIEVSTDSAYQEFLGDFKTQIRQGRIDAAEAVHLVEQADEALRSQDSLEFWGLTAGVRERELQRNLVGRLKDFTVELGCGFCFIGSHYRLKLGDNEYFIGLLFYHRFLKCLAAIELKTGCFQPEYAGKMDFYLEVLNDQERAEEDNPSIGIILCTEKDQLLNGCTRMFVYHFLR